MLWLTFLLAALDDGLTAEARRAATHEVARRIDVPFRPHLTPPPALPPWSIQVFRAVQEAGDTRPNRLPYLLPVLNQFALLCLSTVMADGRRFKPGRANRREMQGLLTDDVLAEIGGPNVSSRFPPLRVPSLDLSMLTHVPPARRAALLSNPSFWTTTSFEPLLACLIAHCLHPKTRTSPLFSAQTGTAVRDWFVQTHPSLVGRTWDDVLREAEAWHRALRGLRGHDVVYRGPVPDALVVLRWPDGWTLQRLMDKRDFAREGIAMGHCVGGSDTHGLPDGDSDYWRKTRDGTGVIFSVRDPNGMPWATMEVRMAYWPSGRLGGRSFAQAMGPDDGPIHGAQGANSSGGAECFRTRDHAVAALVALEVLLNGRSPDSGLRGGIEPQVSDALSLYHDWPDLTLPETARRLRRIPTGDLGLSLDPAPALPPSWRVQTGKKIEAAIREVLRGVGRGATPSRVAVGTPPDGYVTEKKKRTSVALFGVEVDGAFRRIRGTIGLSPGTKKPTWWVYVRPDGGGTPVLTTVPSLVDALVAIGPPDPVPALGIPTWFPDVEGLVVDPATPAPTWMAGWALAPRNDLLRSLSSRRTS